MTRRQAATPRRCFTSNLGRDQDLVALSASVDDMDQSGNGRRHGRASDKGLADRKSVVEGKRVSVRVDLGGRRIIKKQNIVTSHQHHARKRSRYRQRILQNDQEKNKNRK